MFASRMRAPIAVCLLVSSSAVARADDITASDARAIAQARAAIEAVDYEAAATAVRPLLSSPSPRVRSNALEITAVAQLLAGHLVEGRQAADDLHALAPGFLLEDPTLPPRVTSELEAAAQKPRSRAVTPALRAVDDDARGFELTAAGATSRVAVACRAAPRDPFRIVPTNQAGRAWRFELPRGDATACHVIAFDAAGIPIGRLGTPASPVDLHPHALATATASAPVTTRWWFWTGVGAVIVAGAAVTYAATRPSESAPPKADVTISALKGARIAW